MSLEFIGRMLANSSFIYMLRSEEVATIGSSVWWEVKNRKYIIKQQWVLTLVDVLTVATCNDCVVWSLALCYSNNNGISKKGAVIDGKTIVAGERKDGINNNVGTKENGIIKNSSFKHFSSEDDVTGKTSNGLLTLCNFTKVPTKTDSSVTLKYLKADADSVEQETIFGCETTNDPQALLEEKSWGGPNQISKSDYELPKDLFVHSCGVEQGKCI
ncbi:hypothetical protein V6N13_123772 [Hibiscus sabdariffa]|uniref:Uncharacterized protein n=1 Tax=Hibiscus sabdariffa TaxID=183260 RepID=A0ABR2QUI8_9ROSI